MQRYGIILGQGRSGTSWMMDTFDAAPDTFCRNEPDGCAGSPLMARLPTYWLIGDGPELMEERWDEVVQGVATTMGERDHRINHPKSYVYPLAQRLGVAQASARPKIRRYASMLIPSWRAGEWKMPIWVGPGPESPDVVSVLKLGHCYNWAAWVLQHRPTVPIVHVVRHPGGRHDSFVRRYVSRVDAEETRQGKIEQLRRLVATSPEWAERIGPVDDLSLAQAETWFGVYQMETIESLVEPGSRYLRVVYEEMVFDPVTTAKQVFALFGLNLGPSVEAAIEADRRRSVFGPVDEADSQAFSWRDRLDQASQDEIAAILAGSSIRHWWPDR